MKWMLDRIVEDIVLRDPEELTSQLSLNLNLKKNFVSDRIINQSESLLPKSLFSKESSREVVRRATEITKKVKVEKR
jgi:HEPN domain-containing protein